VAQGLTKLLSDNAKACVREVKFESYFGRKVAIDASMHIYQFMARARSLGALRAPWRLGAALGAQRGPLAARAGGGGSPGRHAADERGGRGHQARAARRGRTERSC